MILNLGDFAAGATVYVPFMTFDSNDPSASVTITGLAVTDIEIYKNGSVTQRASDAGYTLLDTDGIDFDGITGLHGFSIDLSDNTDAGFYAANAWYWVAVSAITVDAATINFWAAVFTIERTGGFVTIITDTEALLVDTEAILVDSEAIIVDTEALLADTEAAITERTTLLTDTEALLVDTEAIIIDSESIIADTEAAITERGTLLTDTEALLVDTEAVIIDTEAVLADTEAAITERATLLTDTEAILTDSEAILADTNELQTDWADAGRLDAILDSVLVDTEAIIVDTEAVLVDTEAAITERTTLLTDTEAVLADTEAIPATVNAEVVDVMRTDEIPDSYAGDGSQPTIAQAIMAIHQFLFERSVSSTTLTVYKPDGTTSAMTFTLGDATSPTSITRSG